MSTRIVNGWSGERYHARVDNLGNLHTNSINVAVDLAVNARNGGVWSVPFSATTDATDKTFVSVTNSEADEDLRISDIRLWMDTPGIISIAGASGTASGGTGIAPVSRTIGVTAFSGIDAQEGADITGLTSSGTLFYLPCDVANRQVHLKTSSNLIIRKNQSIILESDVAATIKGVISVYSGSIFTQE